jgi:NAD(P)-dependent dehydrogenase (short-subunit alcohol dehydrogenase family)
MASSSSLTLSCFSDTHLSHSKACANALTIALAASYSPIAVNACTPGYIITDLTRPHLDGRTPEEAGMKTPREGTKSVMFLLYGDVSGSGRYYGSDAKRSPLDRYRSPGDPEYTGEE